MVKPPGYCAFQKAARRLIGPRALVYFSSRRLGDENWGTAFNYLDFKVCQIRPTLGLDDQVKTLIHEALHHLNDEVPSLERINGKLQFTGLRPDWNEARIYAAESDLMSEIQKRWARFPRINPDLFQIGRIQERYISTLLDCVY